MSGCVVTGAVRALAVVVLLLAAGCGGGTSTNPTPTPTPEQPVSLIVRGPYLQHSDTGTRVVWYTQSDPSAEPGRVRWTVGTQTGQAAASAVTSSSGTRYEAEITPIIAAARYTYRTYSPRGLLVSNNGAVDFSFTAPSPDVLRIVVFGDSGKGTPEQSAVAQRIGSEAQQPDMVMIVGDVIYPPADEASYEPRFFAPYRSLLPAIPFYALLGNHDYEIENGKPFFDVFTLPTNGPSGVTPESAYWLTRAGAQMIVHDTNQPLATLRDRSIPWHTSLTRQPATFRLVFLHHALYSSGTNSVLAPVPALRQLLGPVFSSTGIDLVLNGHDHFYERTSPIGGVVYVTTGAGGAELYPRLARNSFTAAFFNERHSYTYVEVSGRSLRLRQADVNGETIDTLTINKPVAAADALRAFAGAGSPPSGWESPAFDDSSWRESGRRDFAAALHARRRFGLARPAESREAVVRVAGAADYVLRLNGVEIARGGRVDEPDGAFPVDVSLLREGVNVLSLEGHVLGNESLPPSLELSLFSSTEPR